MQFRYTSASNGSFFEVSRATTLIVTTFSPIHDKKRSDLFLPAHGYIVSVEYSLLKVYVYEK